MLLPDYALLREERAFAHYEVGSSPLKLVPRANAAPLSLRLGRGRHAFLGTARTGRALPAARQWREQEENSGECRNSNRSNQPPVQPIGCIAQSAVFISPSQRAIVTLTRFRLPQIEFHQAANRTARRTQRAIDRRLDRAMPTT